VLVPVASLVLCAYIVTRLLPEGHGLLFFPLFIGTNIATCFVMYRIDQRWKSERKEAKSRFG
jgi:hypothetical protein